MNEPHPQALAPHQQLAKDIYKELMEINTVTATGDTLKAAEAMAARLKAYGHSGRAGDVNENCAHGQDERIPVKSFFEGTEYLYRLVKALSSGAR